jgi:hypothetical protein
MNRTGYVSSRFVVGVLTLFCSSEAVGEPRDHFEVERRQLGA